MLRLLLVLYAFAIPYETLWSGIGGSQTIFKPYRLIALAAFAFWGAALLRRGRRPRLDLHDKVFLTLFALGLAIAALWSVFAAQGSLAYAANATALGLFAWAIAFVTKGETRSAKDLDRLWLSFVVGNLSALAAAFVVDDPYFKGRLVGYYENPNSLAFSLAASAHYLVARLLRRPWRLASSVVVACIVGLSVAILLTGSRAGIIAYGASLLVSFFLVPRRSGRLKLQLPVAALLIALIGYAGYETWQGERDNSTALRRLEWEHAQDGSGRRDIWRAGWNVAQDHYFIGVGTAQYRYYHNQYIQELDMLYSPSVAEHNLGVHSEYLNILISNGIIGVGLYVFLLVCAARISRRALSSDASAFPGVHAALPVLLLLAIVQITAILFGSPLFFFLMALVALAGRMRPASAPRQQPVGGLRPAVDSQARSLGRRPGR